MRVKFFPRKREVDKTVSEVAKEEQLMIVAYLCVCESKKHYLMYIQE